MTHYYWNDWYFGWGWFLWLSIGNHCLDRSSQCEDLPRQRSTGNTICIPHLAAPRQHARTDHEDATRHAVEPHFLASVVRALDHVGGTLLAGPGNSKFELKTYMIQHRPDLAERISEIETLDDADDARIVAKACQFFSTRGHRHMVKGKEVLGKRPP